MENILSHHFYSGTSGLVLPFPKHEFPAPFKNTSRLTYYSNLFNSLEVNSSFYRIPKLSTAYQWAASVPEHFKFTFKMWRGITHEKGFEFNKTDVVRFIQTINQVGIKKGCILIQLPPSIGNQYIKQLEKLVKWIMEQDSNWKIAIEFRNKSWYDYTTLELLNSLKVALVMHDMPLSATPLIDQKADFVYLRFHGPTGNYSGSYSEDFLRDYVNYVSEWIAKGKEVYLYFNNTIGDALKNLEYFNTLIHEKQKQHA